MSTRVSYLFVVVFLLLAAGLRLWQISAVPPGLNTDETTEARIIETARQGRIEVFYEIGTTGYEGLYGVGAAAFTSVTGAGVIGYRMLSVFAGLLTLALVYALGKRLFGTEAGFAALALLTVTMFPIVLSRAVVPDMLLPLLVTAVLLALARSLSIYGGQRLTEPDTIPFAALGALIGLSLYVHPVGFAITLIAGLVIIGMALRRVSFSPRTFSYLWFALVVAIVIATPYLISSLQNPNAAGAGRLLTLADNPFAALINAVGSLIFVGDVRPLYNVPGRPMFDLISAIFILLGLVAAVTGWRQPRYFLLIIAVGVLIPVKLLGTTEPDFINFAPLLPIIALLFGLGVVTVYRGLPARPRTIRLLLIVGMIALVGFNLQWTVRDLFGIWPADTSVQAAYMGRIGGIAQHLDRTADDRPTVICTSDVAAPQRINGLTTPQRLGLLMHNREVHLRYADCGQALVLPAGGSAAQVVFPEAAGVNGVYPYLRNWLATPVERDPGLPAGVVHIDAAVRLADTVGAFTTTAPVTFAPEAPGGAEVTALPVRFGGNLTFLGDVRTWEGAYRPGDFVTLTTFWRVDGVLPPDLRLFAHVLSDPAAIVAQADGIGIVPAQLRPRDVFVQIIFIQLPATLPPGEYRVSIGAYEAGSRARLAVYDGIEPRGSRLFTGTITVE